MGEVTGDEVSSPTVWEPLTNILKCGIVNQVQQDWLRIKQDQQDWIRLKMSGGILNLNWQASLPEEMEHAHTSTNYGKVKINKLKSSWSNTKYDIGTNKS